MMVASRPRHGGKAAMIKLMREQNTTQQQSHQTQVLTNTLVIKFLENAVSTINGSDNDENSPIPALQHQIDEQKSKLAEMDKGLSAILALLKNKQ
jgi:hypothetical protein